MKMNAKHTYEFKEMNPHERLWNIILYIAQQSEGDERFGKVKLAKILYFADFKSFRLYHQPITGSRYVRLDNGPVPDTFRDILEEMKSVGAIAIRIESHYNLERQRVIALQEPDLTLFNGRDIVLVNKVLSEYRNSNASQLSELSHGVAWRLAQQMEAIPYESSLISDEGVTQEDIDHVQELVQIYGTDPRTAPVRD